MPKTGLDNGYGAYFVRLYYRDIELTPNLSHFSYKFDEVDDDVAKIVIEVDDRNECDKPHFQEKAELKVIWGYIEGEISRRRKLFIQEIDWSFGSDKIQATIKATEKAVSMKFSDSNEVHKNTNIVGLAQKMAQKHDLKAYIEADPDEEDLPSFLGIAAEPGQYVSSYLIKVGKNRTIPFDTTKNIRSVKIPIDKTVVDYTHKSGISTVQNPTNIPTLPVPTDTTKMNAGQKKALENLKQFDRYNQPIYKPLDNVPQAGKTDKQLLQELAERQNRIIETRDDELIIKRRNMNQKPFKSFTYGGDTGDIIDFKPMSKIRSKKSTAMAVGVSGWDPLNKTAFSGSVSGLADDNPTLALFRKMLVFYKHLENIPTFGGLLKLDPRIKLAQPFSGTLQSRSDATSLKTQVDVNAMGLLTVHDKVLAMEKALDTYVDHVQNGIYDPNSTTAEDAFQKAYAQRKNAELKMNPATATIYGNPDIEVGIIITILGVGKKYSGNYYVTAADHTLLPKGGGYVTDLEMVRQGHNVKASDEDINASQSGAKTNRTIGPDKAEKTKRIKTKVDPPNNNKALVTKPHFF